jgi:hypothetical protein
MVTVGGRAGHRPDDSLGKIDFLDTMFDMAARTVGYDGLKLTMFALQDNKQNNSLGFLYLSSLGWHPLDEVLP